MLLRPRSILLVACALLLSAAADERLTHIVGQLTGAKDARLRAQAAMILVNFKGPEAVDPLCAALDDESPLVRNAAAKSLGTLGLAPAVPCLKKHRGDPDASVKAEIVAALATLQAPKVSPRIYVAFGTIYDKGGKLGDKMVALAESELRSAFAAAPGLLVAPKGETTAAGADIVKKQKLKGYMLNVALESLADGWVRMDALCLSYPERKLIGEVAVSAHGADADDLIRALAPGLVDHTNTTLHWSSP